MHKEEKDTDQLRCHCAANELCQDNLSSSMSQRAMSEEEVGEPIQVLHLYIRPGQHIRLLVVLDESDGDVSLLNRHFISLLRDDTDHIAQLALDGELSYRSHHELSLDWRDRGANAKTAEVAQGEEEFLKRLVT